MRVESYSKNGSKDPAGLAASLERIGDSKKVSREAKMNKLREAARDFESVFVHSLLKSMRDTIPKSDFINGGNAENIYRDMLDDEYSKIMVTRSDFGIARKIYEQFEKTIR